MEVEPRLNDPPRRPGDQDREPATRGDLRALRRWVLVAGVWAVAATAVAIIALLDTSNDDAERSAGDAATAPPRSSARGRRRSAGSTRSSGGWTNCHRRPT